MEYRPVPLERESLITKAAEEIRRLIREENLKAEDALPPETQLAQMLGVSRNSVREALRILDGLGFIEKRPGRRAVVKSPVGRPQQTFDVASLSEAIPVAYRVRTAIEEKCAELLARAPSDEALADLESQLALLRDALKGGDLTAAGQAHAAFHVALVMAARNPVLSSMFEPVRLVVEEMSRRGQEMFKRDQQIGLHAKILDAIRTGNSRAAVNAVRRHFHAVAPLVEFVSKQARPSTEGPDGSSRS